MDQLIQQVNFYQPLFHKKRESFSSGVITGIISVAALIMLLVTVYTFVQLEELKDRADLIEQKKRHMQVQLEELKEKLKPREENQLLLAERDNLAGDLRDARRQFRLLDQEIKHDGQHYSAYFRGLAESSVEGLWLKQLRISQGGNYLSLSGETLKPELVPRLLKLLKNKPVFVGHGFADVQMSRGMSTGTEDPVLFQLQTVSSQEPSDER